MPGTARRVRATVASAALAAAFLTVGATAAQAEFGLAPDPLDPGLPAFSADAFAADDTVETQAGSHPYRATVDFRLNTREVDGQIVPDGNVKDIVVDLPVGLVGNPQATPTCTTAQLVVQLADRPTACPVDAQIGTTFVELNQGSAPLDFQVPVYNMATSGEELAAFAFTILGVPVRLTAALRPEDDGIRVTAANVNETLGVIAARFSFWGVPADPAHDPERAFASIAFDGFPPLTIGGNVASTAVPRPFVTLPFDCSHGRFATGLALTSWQDRRTRSYAAPSASGVAGCERLRFEPQISVAPSTGQAGAPTGLDVELRVPQNDEPSSLATPALRSAVVRLPEGMRVSPSSAHGLLGCSDAQIALRSSVAPSCPAAAKIGDVEIETPLLPDPLRGEIVLGTQTPTQLLRLFLVVRGPGGLLLKLPGVVDPDPRTGRLTATFADNPQLPFSRLSLRFKTGPRAPLSNPVACGAHVAEATLSSWAPGISAEASSSFQVDRGADGGGCGPQRFAPAFRAGTTNAAAGRTTSFVLSLSRSDADQELRDVAVALPPGVLGHVSRVALCPAASAAAGTCDDASRIGTVTTGAGPGSSPLNLAGRVHLTESYGGAPFGMSIVVPAVAGPFDLGVVVVRAAVFLDRETAVLRVVSDPFPSILAGIPLQLRSIHVAIDRPGFMVNPTSCRERRVTGSASSLTGTTVGLSSRFQVGDCRSLPFRPRLSLTVGRRGRTRAGITTPLTATLRTGTGDANARVVDVTLPRALNSRLEQVRRACTLAAFQSGSCGEAARIGSAVAITPLLRDPLAGPAYFVRNPARRLPDVMVALRGQVAFDLVGKVRIARNLSLRTQFDTIPDVPISRFTLRLHAGRRGALGAVENLCRRETRSRAFASLRLQAQDGRRIERRQLVRVAGCRR